MTPQRIICRNSFVADATVTQPVWLRAVSLAVCAIFIWSNILFAQRTHPNFWEERQKNIEARGLRLGTSNKTAEKTTSSPKSQVPVLLAQLPALQTQFTTSGRDLEYQKHLVPAVRSLPLLASSPQSLAPVLSSLAPYAEIKEVYLSNTKTLMRNNTITPFVVHIQDVHENYEAQQNISSIIQTIISHFSSSVEYKMTQHTHQVGTRDWGLEASNDNELVPSPQPLVPVVVGLEGSWGPLDLTFYRSFPNKKVTSDIVDYFLKQGFLSGPEHAGITMENGDVKLFGVEGKALYQNHVKAFKEAVLLEKQVKVEIEQLQEQLRQQKKKVFVPVLLELDSKMSAYHKGELGLGEYLTYLSKTAESRKQKAEGNGLAVIATPQAGMRGKQSVVAQFTGGEAQEAKRLGGDAVALSSFRARPLGLSSFRIERRLKTPDKSGNYKNINLFLEALHFEKSLDFTKVEQERKEIIEVLAEKLPKFRADELINTSLAYRQGQITGAEFYNYFQNVVAGFSLRTYPDFSKYIRYVIIADRINHEGLFNEIHAFEEKVFTTVARFSPHPNEIIRVHEISKDITLVEKLLDHSLTPEEWKTYKSRKHEINELAERINYSLFENFFEYAESRNQALVDNLLTEFRVQSSEKEKTKSVIATPQVGMQGKQSQVITDREIAAPPQADRNDVKKIASSPQSLVPVVLVAGGFHTPGITRILRERNVPFAVVTPRITKLEGKATDYLNVFRRGKTPLEKLFTGERLTLKAIQATNPASEFHLVLNRLFSVLELSVSYALSKEISDTDQTDKILTAKDMWSTDLFQQFKKDVLPILQKGGILEDVEVSKINWNKEVGLRINYNLIWNEKGERTTTPLKVFLNPQEKAQFMHLRQDYKDETEGATPTITADLAGLQVEIFAQGHPHLALTSHESDRGGIVIWIKNPVMWLLRKWKPNLTGWAYDIEIAFWLENLFFLLIGGVFFGLPTYFYFDSGNLALALQRSYLSSWFFFFLGHTNFFAKIGLALQQSSLGASVRLFLRRSELIASLLDSRAPPENLKPAGLISLINLLLILIIDSFPILMAVSAGVHFLTNILIKLVGPAVSPELFGITWSPGEQDLYEPQTSDLKELIAISRDKDDDTLLNETILAWLESKTKRFRPDFKFYWLTFFKDLIYETLIRISLGRPTFTSTDEDRNIIAIADSALSNIFESLKQERDARRQTERPGILRRIVQELKILISRILLGRGHNIFLSLAWIPLALHIFSVAAVDAQLRIEPQPTPSVRKQVTPNTIKDMAVLESLVNNLGGNDLNARMYAIEALAELRDSRTVSLLIQLLTSENATTRSIVANVLGETGDSRAVGPLLKIILENDGNPPTVRAYVARALGALAYPMAIDALIIALGDSDPFVRLNAAWALGRFKDNKAVAALIMALDDENTDVIRNAMESLGEIGDTEAVNPLIKILSKTYENWRVTAEAAMTLGKIRDPKAIVPLLNTAFNHPDYNARAYALEVLGQFDHNMVLKTLKDSGLLPKKENVLPKERSNRTNARIIIMDHFTTMTHGDDVMRDAIERRGKDKRFSGIEIDKLDMDLYANIEEVLDELKRMVEKHNDAVTIVNLSKEGFDPLHAAGILPVETVKELGEKGVIFVVAAGNAGRGLLNINTNEGILKIMPEYTNNVLFVAAGNPDGNKADYSDMGPHVFLTALPIKNRRGTSLAAPALTVVLAGTLKVNPNLSELDAIERIAEETEPMPNEPLWNEKKKKSLVGHGLLRLLPLLFIASLGILGFLAGETALNMTNFGNFALAATTIIDSQGINWFGVLTSLVALPVPLLWFIVPLIKIAVAVMAIGALLYGAKILERIVQELKILISRILRRGGHNKFLSLVWIPLALHIFSAAVEAQLGGKSFQQPSQIKKPVTQNDIKNVPAFETFINNLESNNATVRALSAKALGEMRNSNAVIPLMDLLYDENVTVRASAARALGELGDPRATEVLIYTLKYDYDPLVQVITAWSLGEIGNHKAVLSLINALKNGNSDVRANTAEALGKIGNDQAVIPLIMMLRDKSKHVRTQVVIAMGKIGDPIFILPLIKRTFTDFSKEVRFYAGEALSKMEPEIVLEILDESGYLPQMEPTLPLERGNTPKVMLVVLAHFTTESDRFITKTHGGDVIRRIKQVLGNNAEVEIYPLDYEAKGASALRELEYLIRKNKDTFFIVTVPLTGYDHLLDGGVLYDPDGYNPLLDRGKLPKSYVKKFKEKNVLFVFGVNNNNKLSTLPVPSDNMLYVAAGNSDTLTKEPYSGFGRNVFVSVDPGDDERNSVASVRAATARASAIMALLASKFKNDSAEQLIERLLKITKPMDKDSNWLKGRLGHGLLPALLLLVSAALLGLMVEPLCNFGSAAFSATIAAGSQGINQFDVLTWLSTSLATLPLFFEPLVKIAVAIIVGGAFIYGTSFIATEDKNTDEVAVPEDLSWEITYVKEGLLEITQFIGIIESLLPQNGIADIRESDARIIQRKAAQIFQIYGKIRNNLTNIKPEGPKAVIANALGSIGLLSEDPRKYLGMIRKKGPEHQKRMLSDIERIKRSIEQMLNAINAATMPPINLSQEETMSSLDYTGIDHTASENNSGDGTVLDMPLVTKDEPLFQSSEDGTFTEELLDLLPEPYDTRLVRNGKIMNVFQYVELLLLTKALEMSNGNQQKAGDLMRFSPRKTNYAVQQYNIKHPNWRKENKDEFTGLTTEENETISAIAHYLTGNRDIEHFFEEIAKMLKNEPDLSASDYLERILLTKSLEKADWVQQDAAQLLGITPRVMNYKVHKYHIMPGDGRTYKMNAMKALFNAVKNGLVSVGAKYEATGRESRLAPKDSELSESGQQMSEELKLPEAIDELRFELEGQGTDTAQEIEQEFQKIHDLYSFLPDDLLNFVIGFNMEQYISDNNYQHVDTSKILPEQFMSPQEAYDRLLQELTKNVQQLFESNQSIISLSNLKKQRQLLVIRQSRLVDLIHSIGLALNEDFENVENDIKSVRNALERQSAEQLAAPENFNSNGIIFGRKDLEFMPRELQTRILNSLTTNVDGQHMPDEEAYNMLKTLYLSHSNEMGKLKSALEENHEIDGSSDKKNKEVRERIIKVYNELYKIRKFAINIGKLLNKTEEMVKQELELEALTPLESVANVITKAQSVFGDEFIESGWMPVIGQLHWLSRAQTEVTQSLIDSIITIGTKMGLNNPVLEKRIVGILNATAPVQIARALDPFKTNFEALQVVFGVVGLIVSSGRQHIKFGKAITRVEAALGLQAGTFQTVSGKVRGMKPGKFMMLTRKLDGSLDKIIVHEQVMEDYGDVLPHFLAFSYIHELLESKGFTHEQVAEELGWGIGRFEEMIDTRANMPIDGFIKYLRSELTKDIYKYFEKPIESGQDKQEDVLILPPLERLSNNFKILSQREGYDVAQAVMRLNLYKVLGGLTDFGINIPLNHLPQSEGLNALAKIALFFTESDKHNVAVLLNQVLEETNDKEVKGILPVLDMGGDMERDASSLKSIIEIVENKKNISGNMGVVMPIMVVAVNVDQKKWIESTVKELSRGRLNATVIIRDNTAIKMNLDDAIDDFIVLNRDVKLFMENNYKVALISRRKNHWYVGQKYKYAAMILELLGKIELLRTDDSETAIKTELIVRRHA